MRPLRRPAPHLDAEEPVAVVRPLDRLDGVLIALGVLVALAVMVGLDATQSTTPNDPSALCEETRPC